MDNVKMIAAYAALAREEILKAMACEIARGGTQRGAAYIHHTMENLMHIKSLSPELIAAGATPAAK